MRRLLSLLALLPLAAAIAAGPQTTTLPEVGLSSPAIKFRSVDLPEPDGPISAK